ncbi:hypothetical protein HYS95_00745 [Candidatus Daviesbacteria bacterium]|nr:hypothetical protein [Candidatus Daviesbacteria bacterium]
MPVLALERETVSPLKVVTTCPTAIEKEETHKEVHIVALSPIERFHDRKLGKLIATLVADQRQNYHVNPDLVSKVAIKTASVTENPSRKTGRALSKMIAKLEDRVNSAQAVSCFINTINPINNVHTLI